MKFGWRVVVILLLTQSVLHAKKHITPCSSDTNGPLSIPYEAPIQMKWGNSVQQAVKRRESINYPHMAQRMQSRLVEIAEQIGEKDFALELKKISISVTATHTGLGQALKNHHIDIDEAFFRVAASRAHSEAIIDELSTQDKVFAPLFELWNDYFYDAIVSADPLPSLDDEFLCATRKKAEDWPSSADIGQRLSVWIAFVVFHEMGHVLLHHQEHFTEKFPKLSEDPKEWTEQQYEFSRKSELAADQFAISAVRGLGLDGRLLFPGIAIYWAAREARLRHDSAFIPTHPGPVLRSQTLLDELAKENDVKALKEETLARLARIERTASSGPLRELPSIQSDRLQAYSPNIQRYFIRLGVIRASLKKSKGVECFVELDEPADHK